MASQDRKDVLLLEYEKLKEEQITRIDIRDNLIYASIAAAGGAMGFGLTQQGGELLFYVLPIVSFSLGWTYLSNDLKITTIGRYLARAAGELYEPGTFGWEMHHVGFKGRRRRKLYQLAVDIIVFPAAGIFSLAYALTTTEVGRFEWILTGIGFVLSLGLVYEFIRASPLVDADGLNQT